MVWYKIYRDLEMIAQLVNEGFTMVDIFQLKGFNK